VLYTGTFTPWTMVKARAKNLAAVLKDEVIIHTPNGLVVVSPTGDMHAV
jgi:hypothetical protein